MTWARELKDYRLPACAQPCVMYADSSCPFCAKARAALSSMGAMYTVVEFDMDPDGWVPNPAGHSPDVA